MPFTVGDALQLDVLQSCKALTGSAGLQNEVRWVNIIEISVSYTHLDVYKRQTWKRIKTTAPTSNAFREKRYFR